MKVTLDTSVFLRLIGNAPGADIVQKLFDLVTARKLEISTTTLTEAEIEDFDQVLKYRELLSIYHAREISVVNNSLVLNYRKLSQDETCQFQRIKKCLHPNRTEQSYQTDNKCNDADHLFSHWRSGNGFFVTLDKGILKKKNALGKIGVKVSDPSEIIAELE